ncbi:MAG: elongation factor Ts [Bacilli bacterium]|nr:elongation factor Ts [Bacilli bacterium]
MVTAQQVKELREQTGAGMMDCKKALMETDGNLEEAVKWLREQGITKATKKASRISAEGVCAYAIDGNKAVLYEVNSETDFVAKNPKFVELVEQIGKALLASGAKNDEEANEALYEGVKVADLIVNATATIGEKISLRRVSAYEKADNQVFGAYAHMNGKIVSFAILDGENAECAKDVCMHVAAMSPRYLDRNSIDPEYIKSETEILKQEALNEGKPAAIVDKMVQGRLQKSLKEVCLVEQAFVKNPDQTVGEYVKSKNCAIKSFVRLAVGEGIEKRKDDFVAEVMAAVAK